MELVEDDLLGFAELIGLLEIFNQLFLTIAEKHSLTTELCQTFRRFGERVAESLRGAGQILAHDARHVGGSLNGVLERISGDPAGGSQAGHRVKRLAFAKHGIAGRRSGDVLHPLGADSRRVAGGAEHGFQLIHSSLGIVGVLHHGLEAKPCGKRAGDAGSNTA